MNTRFPGGRGRRAGAGALCIALTALTTACGGSAAGGATIPSVAAPAPSASPIAPASQVIVTASLATTPLIATGLSTSDSEPPGTGLVEREGSRGAPTFTDPLDPTTAGVEVPPWSYVRITCRTMTTPTAIPTAYRDGWVYLIESAPWHDKYYAVANTFWNGDVPGDTPYQHNEDMSVPVCQKPIPGES